jgi:hypothetical protein
MSRFSIAITALLFAAADCTIAFLAPPGISTLWHRAAGSAHAHQRLCAPLRAKNDPPFPEMPDLSGVPPPMGFPAGLGMGLGPPPGFEADAFLEIHRQIMGQTGAAAEQLAAIEEVLPGMIMRPNLFFYSIRPLHRCWHLLSIADGRLFSLVLRATLAPCSQIIEDASVSAPSICRSGAAAYARRISIGDESEALK